MWRSDQFWGRAGRAAHPIRALLNIGSEPETFAFIKREYDKGAKRGRLQTNVRAGGGGETYVRLYVCAHAAGIFLPRLSPTASLPVSCLLPPTRLNMELRMGNILEIFTSLGFVFG